MTTKTTDTTATMTADTISEAQIAALRSEAAEAGDLEQVTVRWLARVDEARRVLGTYVYTRGSWVGVRDRSGRLDEYPVEAVEVVEAVGVM